MKKRLVIFDCDGVLVDSEGIANRCLARAATAIGLTLDEAASRRRFVGLSMASVVTVIETELGRPLPPDWLDRLQQDTFARFEHDLTPVPGAPDAVNAVIAAGLDTCVASSGSHDKLALSLGLTRLAPCFTGRIFSASEVAHSKPAPDLFLHAAARMGRMPADCVVIEDSVPGVMGAIAANMTVFGLARETPATALAEAGAHVFYDMGDLPRLLGLNGTAHDALSL